MLSKDHFSDILNEPAGNVAAQILQYCAPRVIYAWDHPEVPDHQVFDDVLRVFHHPAIRDRSCEVHNKMFEAVEKWVQSRPDRGRDLDQVLSRDSVRAGKNHKAEAMPHQGFSAYQQLPGQLMGYAQGRTRDMDDEASAAAPSFAPSAQAEFEPPTGPPSGWRQQHQGEEYTAPTGPPPSHSGYDQPSGSQSNWQGGQQAPAAAFQPSDPYAFPTAYQQGNENVSYEQSFGGPPPGQYGGPPPGQYGGPPPGQYGGPPPGEYGGPPPQGGYGGPPPPDQYQQQPPPGGYPGYNQGQGGYGGYESRY